MQAWPELFAHDPLLTAAVVSVVLWWCDCIDLETPGQLTGDSTPHPRSCLRRSQELGGWDQVADIGVAARELRHLSDIPEVELVPDC